MTWTPATQQRLTAERAKRDPGLIVVWFSCGAASAAALKLTLDRFPGADVRAVNQPIAEEHPDNRRFLRDVAEWCGVEIEEFKASKYPSASAVEVWERRKAMVFPHGAPCTVHLKKDARREWETIHAPDYHVLGFTAEERDRHDRFTLTERDNVIPVLIDAAMTKADCGDMIRAAGIKLPAIYDHGFPNANCLGCVKATSPTYWNHLRREFPKVFDARAEQSRRLGARLVRVDGERVFLDELHPAARGEPMWRMPACSLFCEEWTPPKLARAKREERLCDCGRALEGHTDWCAVRQRDNEVNSKQPKE